MIRLRIWDLTKHANHISLRGSLSLGDNGQWGSDEVFWIKEAGELSLVLSLTASYSENNLEFYELRWDPLARLSQIASHYQMACSLALYVPFKWNYGGQWLPPSPSQNANRRWALKVMPAEVQRLFMDDWAIISPLQDDSVVWSMAIVLLMWTRCSLSQFVPRVK